MGGTPGPTLRTSSLPRSGLLQSGATAVGSFVLVVATYVVLHESIHLAVDWLLAGELADRCGPVPVVLGPDWAYLAVCYAGGGAAGVNAAITLTASGLYGGAIALAADRSVRDIPARIGLVVGAAGATLHLAAYVANTGTLSPRSAVPTDSATVIATLGVEWLLPAAAAVLLSTVAVSYALRRLWPTAHSAVHERAFAGEDSRSG